MSAKTLHVAIETTSEILEFANTAVGHSKLLKALKKGRAHAQVVVEATSTYHLDFCLKLAADPHCQVMVANPRVTHHFHNAQNIRAKTDKVDALSLLAFAIHMPFEPWIPPARHVLELRATTRYIAQMIKEQTRLKNQLASLGSFDAAPSWVAEDLSQRLRDLAQRIDVARARALELAKRHPEIWEHVQNLDTIDGIGPNTAVCLVAEFLVLDNEMTSKQITAWAGLDPRPKESGSSVRGRRSISKRGNARVRALLYMPAVTNTRSKGPLGDFYRRVLDNSGHNHVALVAAMRKLLIISWAVYRARSTWDPSRAQSTRSSAAAA